MMFFIQLVHYKVYLTALKIEMDKHTVLMYSTAYKLWTFTWFVHFELSGWKGLKKFIPRDSFNSSLYILFSMDKTGNNYKSYGCTPGLY